MECHAQHPFDGILADGRHARPEVTDATPGLVGEACWDSERRLEVPRIGFNLADALAPILSRAKDVIVVDAYFNPSLALPKSKWLRPIEWIASKVRVDGELARFEVHALSPGGNPGRADCSANTVATIWVPLCVKAYQSRRCCGKSALAALNSTSD